MFTQLVILLLQWNCKVARPIAYPLLGDLREKRLR